MANRLTVILEQPEYSALVDLAVNEMRSTPDQLRWVLRQHLAERGMLPPEKQGHKASQQRPVEARK